MKRFNTNDDNSQFAKTPYWLISRDIKEISQGAKLCYARLRGYAGNDGKCFPSYNVLAKSLGVSRQQAMKYIKELEKNNLIKKNVKDTGSNVYLFFTHSWMEGSIQLDTPLVSNSIPPSIQLDTPLVSNSIPIIDNIIDNRKDNLKEYCAISKKTPPKPIEEFSEAFETAWSFYPKRSGANSKEETYIYWRSTLNRKLTEKEKTAGVKKVTEEELIDATKRYQIYCTHKNFNGTEYVMQGRRFFGRNKHYKNAWEVKNVKQSCEYKPKISEHEMYIKKRLEEIERS